MALMRLPVRAATVAMGLVSFHPASAMTTNPLHDVQHVCLVGVKARGQLRMPLAFE